MSTDLETAFLRTVDERVVRLARTWPALTATGCVGGIDICLGLFGFTRSSAVILPSRAPPNRMSPPFDMTGAPDSSRTPRRAQGSRLEGERVVVQRKYELRLDALVFARHETDGRSPTDERERMTGVG
jgi:hypothetical protein